MSAICIAATVIFCLPSGQARQPESGHPRGITPARNLFPLAGSRRPTAQPSLR
jgi:hypothetical protein